MGKRIILTSIQILLIGLVIITLKPNKPIEYNSLLPLIKGETESLVAEVKGGLIKLSISTDANSKKSTIETIDFLTDGGKVNKLNQKRSLKKIKHEPELLGENAAFEPLLVIKATGPLNLKIKAEKSFDFIEFHIPEMTSSPDSRSSSIVEVYPKFNQHFLRVADSNQNERIKIYAQKNRGPYRLAESYKIIWSGPQDLFLSHENLIDLAALTGTRLNKTPAKPPANWLVQIGEKIKGEDLRYEVELEYQNEENQGWQKIRTWQEIIKAKAANCLDLSTWVSKSALESGYKSYIIMDSSHAFCAVSLPEEDFSDAIVFETTDYLKPPLKPPTTPEEQPREYEPGEEVIYPERDPPRSPEKKEIFFVDLDYWAGFYTDN
jgi:hypothetical protein